MTIIIETNLSRFICGKVGEKTDCREVILSSIFSLQYKAIPWNVLSSSLIWMFGIQIFIVVFYRHEYLKKSKQIYEIRHIQIDELPRTKVKNTDKNQIRIFLCLNLHPKPKNSTQLSLLTSEQL